MEKYDKKRINNISQSEIQDRKISFAIIFQFCMLITNYTFKHLFNITNTSIRETISFIFMLLVGAIFLKNLHIVFKRIGKLVIGVYFIFAFIFLINILIFNQNIEYIKNISFYFFLICLPTFLYYLAIENKVIFLKMIIKSAYYQIALGILFIITTDFTVGQYDMVYSYLILVPIIILLYKLYNKFNVLDFILVIFGVCSILIIGSRGPILSIILFNTVFLLINLFKNKMKIKYGINLLLITIFFVFVYFDELLYKIDMFLRDYGISSRTMYLLMNNNADFSSGRLDIYKLTIEEILKKPILGYGLAGDRIFLNGTYPHNIFLEVLAQFGVVFGSLILIIFVFYWFIGMVLNKNKTERDLAIMFFGIGVVQLFVSGSYITSANFWLFMSICINSIHFRKNKCNFG
jgi:O-antigen ligase